jgi:hypothetical protein
MFAHRPLDLVHRLGTVLAHHVVLHIERAGRRQILEPEGIGRIPEEQQTRPLRQQELPAADPVRVGTCVDGIDGGRSPCAAGCFEPKFHRERVYGDTDTVEYLGAGEEHGSRVSQVRRVVAGNDRIEAVQDLTDRHAVDRHDLGTDEVFVRLPRRGDEQAVGELPDPDGEAMHGLGVVRRPHPHVSVASVGADQRDEMHDPGQDLVVVQTRQRRHEAVDRPIERCLRHAVEEVGMDRLHLLDQVGDVLGPTLLACEGGSGRSRRSRDARRGGSAVRGARRRGEHERDDQAERSSSHPGASPWRYYEVVAHTTSS